MKRPAVIGLVAAAALLVAGGGLAWWLLTRPPGPDETARAYLEALAAGDGERALSLTIGLDDASIDRAGALAGAEELVTDAVLESVGSIEAGEPRATVRFMLDGEERSASYGLVEEDGRWLVAADGLGTLESSTTLGDAVLVGGVRVPVSARAALLPAVYAVDAAPAGILTGATTAVVLPGEASVAAVEASVAPEATTLAQARIDAYAAECARPAAAVPDSCGLRVPWAADLVILDAITFRIEQTPQVLLSPDLRTFAATDGVIVATASGATRDGASGSFTYRADDWALRGTIALTPDGMQLAVD